jgi:hypothetical protein
MHRTYFHSGHILELVKVRGVATIKGGPAMHTVSESGTAFARPAGPSMPPMNSMRTWRSILKAMLPHMIISSPYNILVTNAAI